MPDTKTYHGGALPEVTVTAENLLRKRLLNLPGKVYHNNPAYFRDVMNYMRRIGDKEAEQRIFMKSFAYGREEASKKVLLSMGGVVAVGFLPAIAAKAGTFALAGKVVKMGKVASNMYKVTTYWRMGINAGTQALLSKDGWQDIDYISVVAEGFNPLMGISSNAIEWRPLQQDRNDQFRSVFHNKTISETIFDMFASGVVGKVSDRISTSVKSALGDEMNVKQINCLMNNVVFPIFHTGFHLSTEVIKNGTKKKYQIGTNESSEK